MHFEFGLCVLPYAHVEFDNPKHFHLSIGTLTLHVPMFFFPQ